MAATLTTRQTESAIALIQTGQLILRLQKHALAKRRDKLLPTQIKAIEILISRTLPVLSAIDATIHTDGDELTEAQIMSRISSLLDAHPDLMQRVIDSRGDAALLPAIQGESTVIGQDEDMA